MISDVLVLLKDQLNNHLNAGWDPSESREDQVVFIDGENMEPINFKLGAISVLLINVEEENSVRPADMYRRTNSDGTQQKIQPDIRLNLYVLFVARFKQYEESLHALSLILQYFQNHRVLNHHNTPALSEDIEKLIVELMTMPFSEQNEIWNSLRTAYHPSVLYKIKMVVFRDAETTAMPELTDKQLRTTAQ